MGLYILVVDDEQFIRDVLCESLVKTGYEVFAAADAQEALEILKSKPVEIVVTDIKMPGIDGLQLTERIKQNHDADVIVMTGYAGDYSYETAITKGASDFLFKPVRLQELHLRLKRVIRERKLKKDRDEMTKKLKELAITDGLTTLFNSRYFYSQLEIEVDRAKRYHQALSLILMDVDKLKPYNDSFGHIEGDKVLARFGDVIRARLRKMDSAYRYGGDEFTVILPSTRGPEALIVAERIRLSVARERFFPQPQKAVSLTISIGVTEYIPEEDPSTFFQRADHIMYASKQEGGNRVSSDSVHNPL